MSKDVYTPNKLFFWKEELDKIKAGTYVPPVNLQLDPTNRCNNHCSFCFYDIFPLNEFSRRDELPTDVIIRALTEFKEVGGKSVEYTGGGEPLIHKGFKEFNKVSKNLGLERALVTNGVELDKNLEDIVDYSWVRVSLNAGSPENYKKVHGAREEYYDRVIENIYELGIYKEKDNVAGISFIVNKDNYKDIETVGNIAKDAGMDNVRYSLAYKPEREEEFEGVWEDITDRLQKVSSLNDDDFKVFSFHNRIKDIKGETKGGFCYYTHMTAVLGANGILYPCCYFKYDDKYNLGNIKDNSFKDLWYGQKRKDFWNETGKDCGASCWMTEKNKLASYITQDKGDVPHLNYP